MINNRFNRRKPFSKKKRNIRAKKKSFLNSSQDEYSFEDMLSDVGNKEIANFFESSLVQAKLNVSQSGDIYEQEADKIANKIVNSNTIQTPKVSRVQGKSGAKNKSVKSNSESKIKGLKGKGNPLPRSIKEYFEPRFGIDLGNVRVHTGNEANQLANSINAKAFTFGKDIVFGQGQFQPDTTEGKKLIAHELTHTVQQDGGQSDVVQRDVKYDDKTIDSLYVNLGGDNFTLNFNFTQSILEIQLRYTGPNRMTGPFVDEENKIRELKITLPSWYSYSTREFNPEIIEIRESSILIDMYGTRELFLKLKDDITSENRDFCYGRCHSFTYDLSRNNSTVSTLYSSIWILDNDNSITLDSSNNYHVEETSINESLQDNFLVDYINFSFNIPANKILAISEEEWAEYEIKTENETEVNLHFASDGIYISFSEGIFIDVKVNILGIEIVPDLYLKSIFYDFDTASVSEIKLDQNFGIGFGAKDKIEEEIMSIFNKLFYNTQLENPGYNPYNDPLIFVTLLRIGDNFKYLFSSSDNQSSNIPEESQFDFSNDTQRLSVSIKLEAVSDFVQSMDDSISIRLDIPNDLKFTIFFDISNIDLNNLDFNDLTISSIFIKVYNGIVISLDNKDIIRINEICLLNGGKIEILDLDDIGSTPAGIESLVRLLSIVIAKEAGIIDGEINGEAIKPHLVEALERYEITRQLNEYFINNIQEYSNLLPGVDIMNMLGIQPKLKVNQSGDIYEQEADKAAEQIINNKNNKEKLKLSKAQKNKFFTKSPASSKFESKINSAINKGKKLPKSLKEYFGKYFGVDFTNIHIHTDAEAAKLADTINAKAFTIGNDIVFGKNEYNPGTNEGKKLIAHELAHTIQQDGGQSEIVQRDAVDSPILRINRIEVGNHLISENNIWVVVEFDDGNLRMPREEPELSKGRVNDRFYKRFVYAFDNALISSNVDDNNSIDSDNDKYMFSKRDDGMGWEKEVSDIGGALYKVRFGRHEGNMSKIVFEVTDNAECSVISTTITNGNQVVIFKISGLPDYIKNYTNADPEQDIRGGHYRGWLFTGLGTAIKQHQDATLHELVNFINDTNFGETIDRTVLEKLNLYQNGNIVDYSGIYPESSLFNVELSSATPDPINNKTVGLKESDDEIPGTTDKYFMPDVGHSWFYFPESDKSFGLGHTGGNMFTGADIPGDVLLGDQTNYTTGNKKDNPKETFTIPASKNISDFIIKKAEKEDKETEDIKSMNRTEYNLNAGDFKNDERNTLSASESEGEMCAAWALRHLIEGGVPLGKYFNITNWPMWDISEVEKAYQDGTLLPAIRTIYEQKKDLWSRVDMPSPAEIYKRIKEAKS